MRDISQLPQPTVPDSVLGVRAANVIPNAGQPMGDNHVEADQQDQHHGSVLNVSVDLAHNSTQAKQPNNLEGTE